MNIDNIPTDILTELVEEYREAFSAFDLDGDGKVDANDILRILTLCN